jgi:hypothetical protein
MGDEELMRDQVNSGSDETTDGGPALMVLVASGLAAERVLLEFVELALSESFLCAALTQGVAELGFGAALGLPEICYEVVLFLQSTDDEGLAVVGRDGFPRLESNATERGIVAGVTPVLPGSGKQDPDLRGVNLDDRAESELGLGLADPALAFAERAHGPSRERNRFSTVLRAPNDAVKALPA